MNSTRGALHFEATMTNDDMKRKLAEIRQGLLNSGRTAEAEGSKIEGMFRRATVAAGAFFTAQQAIGFARQIATVRGEFQQLEVAFKTMLGSKQKADALMAQMVDTAAKTPFDLQSVAGGAKQLLAYGSAAEDINKELVMLGNISAGLSIPLGDMVYLYGTTQTQGRLFTQDMRQFMGRGIPLAEELAKQFGVTKDKISEMVTAGKIGFAEVQKALQAMTGEGGKFHNLMEEQSKTITGQISNLGDAVDVMFNKIGTSQEGLISSVLGGATAIVENYEQVGREIGALVVAYGAYKAAVISFAAVQKTVTTIKHTEEAAELAKLLTVEQQANISKLGLAKTSAEYAAAVKSEVVAEMERQTQLAVTTNAELEASQVRLASAEGAKKQAAELVAAKKAELASVIGVAKAEQVSALEKKIAIESEKQSRAALLATRLNQNKVNAISSIRELQLQASLGAAAGKEVSAINAKIAVKQKEVAIIAKKIAASKAEEVQCSRNIFSLRAEKLAINDSIASKATLKTQSEIETAQQQLNTASLAQNAAAREVSSKRAVVDSAVRRANTLEMGVNTASQAANATATGFLSVVKLKLTAITAKLNAVIMNNPYTIAAVAIAALAYGIYKLCTAQSAAEKAQEAFNEKIEDGKKKQDEFVSKTNELIGVIRTETNTRYMQTKAFKELNDKYPDLLRNMSMEKLLLMDNLELQKLLAQYTEDQDKKELFAGLDDAQKKVEAAKKAYDDYLTDTTEPNPIRLWKLNGDIDEAEEYLKQWQNKLKEHRQIEANARPVNVKIADLSQNITLLENQLAEVQRLQDEAKKNNPFGWNLYEHQIGAINAQISAKQGELKALNEGKTAQKEQDKNKAYWETQKKNAQDALEAMGEAEKGGEKWNAAVAKINQANSKLKQWDISGKASAKTLSGAEKADKEYLKLQQQMREQLDELCLSTWQSRIDIEKDGFEKSQHQTELSYSKELIAIEKYTQDQIELYQNLEREKYKSTHGGSDKGFVATTQTSEDLPDEVQANVRAKTQASAVNYTKENKKLLEDLTKEYQTYADRRCEIETKFDADIATLKSKNEGGKYDDQIAEAKKQKGEALSKVNFEEAKEGIDFTQLFGNLDNMTLPSMESLRDKIKAWIDTAGKELSPEDFKTVSDAFAKLDIKIVDKNPFGEFNDALAERKKATERVVKAQKALSDLEATGVKDGAEHAAAKKELTAAENERAAAIAKQQAALSSAVGKGQQVLGAARDVLGIMDDLGVKVPEEIAGALDGVGQILDGLGSINLAEPLSVVTGAVKMLGGLVKSITSLFGGSKKTMEELARRQKEDADRQHAAEMEINQLYRERYEWAQKIGESTLDYMKRQGAELEKQGKDNAKDQDELMAKLLGTEYKSGEHFKKTGLFGWGKGKIVEDYDSLAGKSWDEIEVLASSGKLSKEGMKYYEALKKAKEEGVDLAQKQEEYLEKARELTTGSTYSGVVNGIVEGFKAGKRSAADFSESFGELMNGAIESALSLLAEQKTRQWYEDFAAAGKDGYTEGEIAALKGSWIDLNEQLAEDAKNLEAVTGGSIGGGAKEQNESSLAGQIRGSVATEASVAELGGIFRGQWDKLISIDLNIGSGLTHLLEIARTNAMVEANTRATAANTAQTVQALGAGFTAMQGELSAINRNTSKDNASYGG